MKIKKLERINHTSFVKVGDVLGAHGYGSSDFTNKINQYEVLAIRNTDQIKVRCLGSDYTGIHSISSFCFVEQPKTRNHALTDVFENDCKK